MQVCRATGFGAGKQIQKSKVADNTRRMSVPGTRIHLDAATNAECRATPCVSTKSPDG